MPTLLIKIPMSRVESSVKSVQKSGLVKSVTIALYCTLSEMLARSYSIFFSSFCLLRDMMQMLNPLQASSSQKPNPIPSVPPVMTAHAPIPYTFVKSFLCVQMRHNVTISLYIQRPTLRAPRILSINKIILNI